MARQLVFVAAFVVLFVIGKVSAASSHSAASNDGAAPAAETPNAGAPKSAKDLVGEATAAAGAPVADALESAAGAALAAAPAPAPSGASSREVSINVVGAIVAGVASFFLRVI
ncbi:hypothetical protein POM88_028291 [Heracleum sosnowskyi]|uniref:Uncharacterized protein n=1 Tax=Heracleum sosnowskyi TaxID=360622 RepID=A0AAD8I970_9APIA|nr:hypothetical protein POM88_028291 [Heracleum sosnowskyi]